MDQTQGRREMKNSYTCINPIHAFSSHFLTQGFKLLRDTFADRFEDELPAAGELFLGVLLRFTPFSVEKKKILYAQ